MYKLFQNRAKGTGEDRDGLSLSPLYWTERTIMGRLLCIYQNGAKIDLAPPMITKNASKTHTKIKI